MSGMALNDLEASTHTSVKLPEADYGGSPWVIEAYRKQALAAGYAGDSILNSLSDTLAMMSGFALARLLPWKATVALVLVLEIAVGALVHDNLTLNILNFIHRFPVRGLADARPAIAIAPTAGPAYLPLPWRPCPPNRCRSPSRPPGAAATTCAATWSACRART